MISDNFHNPIFPTFFDRLTWGEQERGLRPLLVNLSDGTDPQNSVRLMRDCSVDGCSFESGRKQMLRLSAGALNQAYFCGDDVLSIGALSSLKDMGLKVPDDIDIIGLNDMEMAGWENIDLTIIHQPVVEIIEAAIEVNAGLLENSELPPKAQVSPCKIIERSTLRPA